EPGDLGGGEVGVQDEPRAPPYQRFGPRGFESGAFSGCAPVLPHDGAMDGLARRALPDERGFALVGDAERCDLARVEARLRQRLARRCERIAPDVFRVMFDTTGRGVVLWQFPPRHGE